ncbi:MAG: hypothetical protein SO414_05615, partial [Bacteroidaceae bacterium]|nr:hypothetical protein [Bacteroidaceae bacterium]
MISSFHAMIPSFHGMIPSFHAVFGLRHRDKSAKVIDYNDQVIGVRKYLLLLGNPFLSPMFFLLSRKKMGSATFVVERLSRVCQGMKQAPAGKTNGGYIHEKPNEALLPLRHTRSTFIHTHQVDAEEQGAIG